MTKSMSTALTVQHRAQIAIGGSEYEDELRTLASRSAGIVAISNRAGHQECHAARMIIKRERLSIGEKAKAATEDAKAFVAAVGARSKELVAILTPEESRLAALQDGYEAEQERIKEEARMAEQTRIDEILSRIQWVATSPARAAVADISGAQALLADLSEMAIDESYHEFARRAVIALQEAKAAVLAIVERKIADAAEAEKARQDAAEAAAKHAAEMEEARIAKAEQEARITAERAAEKEAQDERDRIAAAARRAEEDRIAADRAKLAAEQAEFEAKRAAVLAEIEADRRRVEAEEAAKRAAAEKAEADARRAADEAAAKERKLITDRMDRISAECADLAYWQLDEVIVAIETLRAKWGEQ
jgi:hypothetical protein